uniref:Odorant receptor n=1 Tax=Stomoxys calcitrans TaxID=35570 RepID=A0A1I8NVP1_STOCA
MPMSKRLSNRFRAIVRITRICADICGADVFDPKFRINIRTILVLVIIQLSIVFMAYTVYVGFNVDGDWKVILQVLSVGGCTLVQGYCKLVNCLREKNNFRFLINELNSLYEKYEKNDADCRLFLYKGIQQLTFIMKLSAFVVILMVVGMGLVTLVLSVVFNTHVLIVQCLIPGFDPTTGKGFLWINIIQIWFIAVGGFGFYAGDMAFFTPLSQISTFRGILKCKFCDLNEILADEPGNKEKSFNGVKDILIFHQRYMVFLEVTRDTYYWVILVQIGTYSIGIICTMFSIHLGTWPGGYVYMIYCFVMMLVYCHMGSLVEVTNEGVVSSCYNDVNWYELSVSERRMLHTMLRMAQNTAGLTIGSVLPLSMNTGVKITKTIYSIAMMLLNFAD